MNAVEHIVEGYLRICRKCFTTHDVKITHGSGRQLDFLAVSLKTGDQFHVECSVTHEATWQPTFEQLVEATNYKFLGFPRKKSTPKSDYIRGKNYKDQIEAEYLAHGLNPKTLRRVWCLWTMDKSAVESLQRQYQAQHQISVDVWSLRDEVMPRLHEEIGKANYDDEILRTLSLMKQRGAQTGIQRSSAVGTTGKG